MSGNGERGVIDELRSTKGRRRFYALIAATCAIIAIVLFVVIRLQKPSWTESVLSFAETVLVALLGGALTTAFLRLFYSFFYSSERQLDAVTVIDRDQTRKAHAEALKSTNLWLHNGHTGRWVRLEALPAMEQLTRSDAVERKAKLLVIDPREDRLLRDYVNYRRLLSQCDPLAPEDDDVEAQRLELLCTVLVAADFHRRGLVRCEVALRKRADAERTDIADHVAFVTLADPDNIALQYNKPDTFKHSFYDAARRSFKQEFESSVSDRLELTGSLDGLPASLDEFDRSHFEAFFEKVRLATAFCESDTAKLKERLKTLDHPYR